MDIQSLQLLVTESEINQFMDRQLAEHSPIDNPRLRLLPEGVVVQGNYPTPLGKMSFETLWSLAASGASVRARLESVTVAGLPAGLLRGVLLKSLRDVAARQPGVQVEGETVEVDVRQAAQARGVSLRINLTAVRCAVGSLIVEATPSSEQGT